MLRVLQRGENPRFFRGILAFFSPKKQGLEGQGTVVKYYDRSIFGTVSARGNQPPYRRYRPDTEIQYRPRWQKQAEFSPKGKPIPDLLFLVFFWKWQGKPPKKQGFFIVAEPLKSLGKKGKTRKKARNSLERKKARKSKKARKRRLGIRNFSIDPTSLIRTPIADAFFAEAISETPITGSLGMAL